MPPPKIIVADDDAIFRRIMTSYLNRSGHEVLEFISGRGVVEAVKAQEILACVLDIMMPDIEGMELLTELGKLDNRPKLISVSSDALYLDIAVELGADAVIQKPVSAPSLRQTLQALGIEAA